MSKKSTILWLVIILLCASCFRFYGLRWDDGIQGYPHPDERHLANTISRIGLRLPGTSSDTPINWSQINDPNYSPLNPRRLIPDGEGAHYDLAYGTLPVYLYKIVAVILSAVLKDPDLDNYYAYGMIGRSVTALFSLLTVLWVYMIGKRLWNKQTGLLGAALLSACVLHIQLSHFMTVDLMSSALLTAGLLFCVRFAQHGRAFDAIGMGALLGLSMACKFTGITLGAGIATSFIVVWLSGKKKLGELALYSIPLGLLFGVIAFGLFEYFSLRDPYTYVHAIGIQAKMVNGKTDWPYTRQYVNTTAFWFQIHNLVLWGMGSGLGLAGVVGVLWTGIRYLYSIVWGSKDTNLWKQPQAWAKSWFDNPNQSGPLVLLGWAIPFFIYTARLEVKFLRYMIPLAPVLCLFAADLSITLGQWSSNRLTKKQTSRTIKAILKWSVSAIVLVASFIWATAYMRVYTQEHPWQAASRWFYKNAPLEATFTWEAWGDLLPTSLPDEHLYRQVHRYRDIMMHPYHDMAPADKLAHIQNSLQEADYVILSTPRIYMSVSRLPWRYPVTIRYYELLFKEQLGFKLAAKFTAYPGLGSIEINDMQADQSFYDYEHPLVLIFEKTRDLTDLEWHDLFAEQLASTPIVSRKGNLDPVELPVP